MIFFRVHGNHIRSTCPNNQGHGEPLLWTSGKKHLDCATVLNSRSSSILFDTEYIYIMNIYIYIIYTYIRTYTYRYKYIYRVTAKYPLPSARTFFRSHHSGLKFMQWCFFCSGVAPGFWLLFWACEAFCHTSWPSTSALHSTGIYCEILGIDLREREGVSRKTYLYFCIASLCKLGGGFPSMSTFACDGNSNVYKFTLKKTNIDVQNQPC